MNWQDWRVPMNGTIRLPSCQRVKVETGFGRYHPPLRYPNTGLQWYVVHNLFDATSRLFSIY